MREASLDLRDERVRAGRRLVPVAEAVLRVDDDAAKPAGETELAEAHRVFTRLSPELERPPELPACPELRGEVALRPAELKGCACLPGEADRLR